MTMQSDSVKNLLPALAAAIEEMADPVKNASNPHFKNKYADLAQVIECAESALAKHKLIVTETLELLDGGGQALRTRVWHTPSGEWLDSVVRLLVEKMQMQPLGSAITYARRYARKSLFGMVDVDDDGQKASKPSKKAEAAALPPVAKFDFVEDAITSLESVAAVADLRKWEERMRVSGFTGSDREQALAARNEKLREINEGGQ
jgi:hypothetical protein